MATLGGFLLRNGDSDGEPRVKTIRTAGQRIVDFAAGVRFMRKSGEQANCV